MADEQSRTLDEKKRGRRVRGRVRREREVVEVEIDDFDPEERLEGIVEKVLNDFSRTPRDGDSDLLTITKEAAAKRGKRGPTLRVLVSVLVIVALVLSFATLLSFRGYDALLAAAKTEEGSEVFVQSIAKYLDALAPFIVTIVTGAVAALIARVLGGKGKKRK